VQKIASPKRTIAMDACVLFEEDFIEYRKRAKMY
jgi:hypothetical protein